MNTSTCTPCWIEVDQNAAPAKSFLDALHSACEPLVATVKADAQKKAETEQEGPAFYQVILTHLSNAWDTVVVYSTKAWDATVAYCNTAWKFIVHYCNKAWGNVSSFCKTTAAYLIAKWHEVVAYFKGLFDKSETTATETTPETETSVEEGKEVATKSPMEDSKDIPEDNVSDSEFDDAASKFVDTVAKFTANLKNQTTLASFPEGFFLQKFESIARKYPYGTPLEEVISNTPVGEQSATMESNGYKLIVTQTKLGVITVGLSDDNLFITAARELQSTDLIKQEDLSIENLIYILGNVEEGSANISDVIARLNPTVE